MPPRKTMAQQLAELQAKMAVLQAKIANPPKPKAPKAQDKFKNPILAYLAQLKDGDKFYINFLYKGGGTEATDHFAKLLEDPDEDNNLLFLVQTSGGAYQMTQAALHTSTATHQLFSTHTLQRR
jgi:hypothetical protein